jgi:hypothetical protein
MRHYPCNSLSLLIVILLSLTRFQSLSKPPIEIAKARRNKYPPILVPTLQHGNAILGNLQKISPTHEGAIVGWALA